MLCQGNQVNAFLNNKLLLPLTVTPYELRPFCRDDIVRVYSYLCSDIQSYLNLNKYMETYVDVNKRYLIVVTFSMRNAIKLLTFRSIVSLHTIYSSCRNYSYLNCHWKSKELIYCLQKFLGELSRSSEVSDIELQSLRQSLIEDRYMHLYIELQFEHTFLAEEGFTPEEKKVFSSKCNVINFVLLLKNTSKDSFCTLLSCGLTSF